MARRSSNIFFLFQGLRICLDQCDQIWRNFATLATLTRIWQKFDSLFFIWQNAEPTLTNL